MNFLSRGSIGASDGESEDHVGAGAVLTGCSGTHGALPHCTRQQVGHSARPPHVHTFQEAHRCDALVIVGNLRTAESSSSAVAASA